MPTSKVIFAPFSGQLEYLPVPNSEPNPNVTITGIPSDSSVVVGDVVIMTNGVAFQASAAQFSTSNAVGIVDSKDSSTTCNIRTSGVTNSIYNNLDTTADYYLSDTQPGKLQSSAPTAPGTVVLRMGQAFTSQTFLINKSVRMVRS